MSEDMTHSELARLVNKKPRWLVRWGMTILFVIMALIFVVMKNVLAP